MLLTPDFNNQWISDNIRFEVDYYDQIYKVLKELGIKIYGIKARHEFYFRRFENPKFLDLNNEKIPFFYGYGQLISYINNIDLVIGPASTALLETLLLKKDYYALAQWKNFLGQPSLNSGMNEIIYVSKDFSQLKDAIINNKIFNDGKSISDLLNLKNFENIESYYRDFEKIVTKLI